MKMKVLFKTMLTVMAIFAMSIPLCSCGDDNDEPDVDQGKYAGQKWVGSWVGSDESTQFYITLGADGDYSDYCIFYDGTKSSVSESTYTVSGNTLTISGSTALANDWGVYPFTMTFSGDNTMTLTNKLLENWGQKLVFTRK